MGSEGSTVPAITGSAAAITLVLAVAAGADQISSQPVRCEVQLPQQVRVTDCRLGAALASGLQRSATLRSLINRIDELHGLVYVETVVEIRTRTNRRLIGETWNVVSAAGSYRLVRVAIERRYDDDAVSLVAHELRHVIEVLESGGVPSAAVPLGSGVSETAEAQRVQRAVALEMANKQ